MADEIQSPEPAAITPEQIAADLKAFQKLVKYAERKQFWKAHKSIQGIVSEINFHA
jgi:hypothetical protein